MSDVAHLTLEAVLRLKRILERVRGADVPFLFLIYGNVARADAQALVLGATDTLPAGAAIKSLRSRIIRMQREAVTKGTAAKLAIEARQYLIQTFGSRRAVMPDVAMTGTELIVRAIRESGIQDWVLAVQRFGDATHQRCLLVAGLAAAFARSLVQ
ncbi:hypothetical protein G3T14_24360 [Methylobacterium sp. BTF04]|uniref:hypothetical protein n=1 Tax=Methylobacterium sp. BTF04 TaxID=2708300 RepID=UPI0013D4348D|nr:hypothetical protein [Methylobacterium sp. BTF04]NEU15158.1 hypothetical protein [Methylobacterium sp. BTF04]